MPALHDTGTQGSQQRIVCLACMQCALVRVRTVYAHAGRPLVLNSNCWSSTHAHGVNTTGMPAQLTSHHPRPPSFRSSKTPADPALLASQGHKHPAGSLLGVLRSEAATHCSVITDTASLTAHSKITDRMRLLWGSVGLARAPCCHTLPAYRATPAALSHRTHDRPAPSRFPAQQAGFHRPCRLYSTTQVREGTAATGAPSQEPQQPAAARR